MPVQSEYLGSHDINLSSVVVIKTYGVFGLALESSR